MKPSLQILIVDEEPIIGELIQAAVEDAGHRVTTACTEQEAMTALTEPFHLLMLHRGLPDAACHELVRRARHHNDPRIVLLSSQRSREAERNMLRLGAAEILYKPLDPQEVRACVERHRDAEMTAPREVPGGPRILVVDDDEAVLSSVYDILEEDYEVVATVSPYEALELLRASPFEILLADLMMDELPGIDLIRAAQNTRPELQTIVMTGYASKASAIAALKEGVHDFLEKPLSPALVRRTVARVWKSMRYALENRRLLAALRDQARERQQLIDELEARNAEIERFTYTVSHDLRSPLVTIKGFLGFLQRDALAGDHRRLERDVQRIATAANKMHRLLDEILELSRIGRKDSPRQAVSLGELAHEAADSLAHELEKQGAALHIASDLPVVRGDRKRLLEVFQNLIGNAASFMGDQTSRRIEVATRPPAQTTSAAAPDEITIIVRDNGIGIDKAYHNKVFELFEQLDPETSTGTGVGLTLVKRIVEIHGGRIWVESEGAGHGTTFCFVLPG